jgi:hypothetical protein
MRKIYTFMIAFLMVLMGFMALTIPTTAGEIPCPNKETMTIVSDTSDMWWSGADVNDIDTSDYIVPPVDGWSYAVSVSWPSNFPAFWNNQLTDRDGTADYKAILNAEPSADWIWSQQPIPTGKTYTGDIVFFKKEFTIPNNAFGITADLYIDADNGYYFYVNGDWSGTPVGFPNIDNGFEPGYNPTNFYYSSITPTEGAGPGATPSATYETPGNLYPLEASIESDTPPSANSGQWKWITKYDISGLVQGDNTLQIVAINEHAPPETTGNPAGLIYKLVIKYMVPSIEKTVTPNSGYLGDILPVELDVCVPCDYTMTVEDHLPTFLNYVPGTFEVDGTPVLPTITDNVISTDVECGGHTITFDTQIIQVEAEEYGEYNWAYLVYDGETVAEDSAWVKTYPYEGFTKYACLILSGPEDDTYIDLNEDVHWKFYIIVENIYDYTINDVVITDRLAAELEIDNVDYVSKGDFYYPKKGNVKMTWEIGTLAPGEEAKLVLEISTKMNKKWQEYTSAGTYEINSGAVVKFIGLNGFQHSAHTGQILFDVPDYWPYCTSGWRCPGITSTSDHIQVLNYIPADVRDDKLESNDYIRVWKEFSGELPVDLYYDLDEGRNAREDGPAEIGALYIPAGTPVCVFMVHFDSEGANTYKQYSDLSLTFGADILGVIISGGDLGTFANRDLMFAADDQIGNSGTIYPSKTGDNYLRGYDVNYGINIDDAEFNGDTVVFDTFVANAHDQMRVIVPMVWGP